MPRKNSSLTKTPQALSGKTSQAAGASGATESSTGTPAAQGNAAGGLRVLLVDAQPHVRQALAQTIKSQRLNVIEAGSLAEARQHIHDQPIDLALIDPHLPDGSGLDLARELSGTHHLTKTILLADQPSVSETIEAMRAGVMDLVCKPVNLKDLNERVRIAIDQQKADRHREQRARRLRKLCRKLDEARQEVTEQVDVLCSDLVVAYQQLALQMQQVVQTSEYGGLIRDELDLEGLLRKTLEYVVQKAGPVNAAIFLPAAADEYALGGYVNYDCTSDSADLLLQHLADVVAPRMTDSLEPVYITDNETISQWIGDDGAYLADSHLLAFTARHDGEALAVVMLFRDGASPFDVELVDSLSAIAPMLGNYLARIIRIHHRHSPDLDQHGDDAPF